MKLSDLSRLALLVVLAASTVGRAQPLDLAETGFPQLNCLFDSECILRAGDSLSHFSVPGSEGLARLQSRTAGPGEEGTPGAGLWSYLYWVRLEDVHVEGPGDRPVVVAFSLPVSTWEPLDYDGDGALDDVFVATHGTSGDAVPSSVVRDGGVLRIEVALRPGERNWSFGLASRKPPIFAGAAVQFADGETREGVPARVPGSSPEFVRGDVDGSMDLRLTDALRTLNWLFLAGDEPPCLDAADTDDDGDVRLSDAVQILAHLFQGGSPPASPYPVCGPDVGRSNLGCETPPDACAAPARCPDLAVEFIGFGGIEDPGPSVLRVEWIVRVRNLGGAFRVDEGPGFISLEESGVEVARLPLRDLEPGYGQEIRWQRDWSLDRVEGTDPPSYTGRIVYEAGPVGADCEMENDRLSRSGADLNEYLAQLRARV